MMFGIGNDLIAIARIEAALKRHGDRFAERILGPRAPRRTSGNGTAAAARQSSGNGRAAATHAAKVRRCSLPQLPIGAWEQADRSSGGLTKPQGSNAWR